MNFYEKIICIYTCKKDVASVVSIKKTNWYKKEVLNKKNKIIFVYAKAIEKEFELINDTLYVNTKEEYSNLSVKTFKMIFACIKLFKFKYLIKIDSTLINYKTNIKELNFVNFQKWYQLRLWKCAYSGIYMHKNVHIDSIKNWCDRKKLSVFPEKIIKSKNISYYSGKCYSINYINCIILSKKRKESFNFKKFLGGIEDIFVSENIKMR